MSNRRISLLDRWIPEKIHPDEEALRKARLLIVCCYSIIGLTTFYTFFYLFISHVSGAIVSIYGGLSALGLLFYFKRTGNFIIGGNFFAFTSSVVMGFYAITTSGISTIIGAWIIMIPMSGFLLANRKSGIFWTGGALLLGVGIYFADIYGYVDKSVYNSEYAEVVNLCSLIGLITFVSVVVYYYENGKDRVRDRMMEVNAKVLDLNRELEEQVGNRTESLIQANEELDTFLYESSHALRRPLARIMGLQELLNMDITPTEKATFNEKIDFTTKDMDKLLQNLILVSEFNNWEDNIQEVAPARLVQSTWDAVMRDHPEADVELKLDLPTQIRLQTDPRLIQIILTKLVENAIHYRKPEDDSAVVNITGNIESGHFALKIRDNGIGIPPQIQPEMFKMFARGTVRSGGSGLGLYMVAKIVNHLGGTVSLTSEFEVYTEIRMHIPLAPAPVPA